MYTRRMEKDANIMTKKKGDSRGPEWGMKSQSGTMDRWQQESWGGYWEKERWHETLNPHPP